MESEQIVPIAASGRYRYEDGAIYVGSWNATCKPHGEGHLVFQDGIKYDGYFENGKCSGIGVLTFPDGARYEGEFSEGWFHGFGTFWRSDGMRYEGEFRGGQICGLGLITFNDGTNGFPKSEGFFRNCKFLRRKNCPETIQTAQKFAFTARKRFTPNI